METFASYKQKLTGYQDVSETVKVIEKIAASALHETNRGMTTLATYLQHLNALIERIKYFQYSSMPISEHTPNKTTDTLLLVFTGDKGLVGDMWEKIYNSVSAHSYTHLLIFGKRGMHLFPENKYTTHYTFQQRIPTQDEIVTLAQLCNTYIQTKHYATITTLHLKPLSLLEHTLEYTQLLPITHTNTDTITPPVSTGYPIIDTDLDTLHTQLSKKYLQGRLRQVILETAIAEFSARTVAMEHAGSKTDEARTLLQRTYFKVRRQHETQKQLERFASNHTRI